MTTEKKKVDKGKKVTILFKKGKASDLPYAITVGKNAYCFGDKIKDFDFEEDIILYFNVYSYEEELQDYGHIVGPCDEIIRGNIKCYIGFVFNTKKIRDLKYDCKYGMMTFFNNKIIHYSGEEEEARELIPQKKGLMAFGNYCPEIELKISKKGTYVLYCSGEVA
jgi:hypothetical protein